MQDCTLIFIVYSNHNLFRFHQIPPYSTRFYQIPPYLLDSTRFYLIPPDSTIFYQILPYSIRFHQILDSTLFYQILPYSTRFHQILDSTLFYQIPITEQGITIFLCSKNLKLSIFLKESSIYFPVLSTTSRCAGLRCAAYERFAFA